MSATAAQARRLAVAAVLAVHDRDGARLHELVENVPAELMPLLVEALAVVADESVTLAMRSPDDARVVLAGVALDLVADLPRGPQRAALLAHRLPPATSPLQPSIHPRGTSGPPTAATARFRGWIPAIFYRMAVCACSCALTVPE